MTEQYIPDIIGSIVQRVSDSMPAPVYFDFGHYAEVTKNLYQKEKSISMRDMKYPLIWMVMDYDEIKNENPDFYSRIPNAHFIIAVPTSKDFTMRQRRDNTFLPVLYPIYTAFMAQLHSAKELGKPKVIKDLRHTKTDRPYWGGNGTYQDGQANMFDDFIDAIQIRNLSPTVYQNCIA